MFSKWTFSSLNRRNRQDSKQVINFAIASVQLLESRQLLSAVTLFPIPGVDASTWSGGAAHIVAGPDGNEWFTDPGDNSIGKVTPKGVVTLFALPATTDGTSPTPSDIIVGPDNKLWFTETGGDAIGRIATDGTITEFHTPTANSNPAGLTVGADGNIWFAESSAGKIGQIAADGTIKEFSAGPLDLNGFDGIAAGSDPHGNVWFIAQDGNYNPTINNISPTGVITTRTLSDYPTALVAGPDGNLWVGTDAGTVDRVSTDGTVTAFALADGASVGSITVGNGGTLWLGLNAGNEFGKITIAGVTSEFNLPIDPNAANSTSISDLVQNTDGSLWFADNSSPQVGTIDLSNALFASGTSVSVTAGNSSTSTFGFFTDFSGKSTASDYAATITLADGSKLDASIAANSTGGFDVSGTHTWTLNSGGNVTVTVTDTRDATRSTTSSTYVDVLAPQATGTGQNVTATAGQTVSTTVASFTGVDVASLASYSANIDWGDGHVTAGTITANSQGGFDVAGANTYAASGTFTISATLQPYAGGFFFGGGPIVRPLGGVSTTPAHASPSTSLINGGPALTGIAQPIVPFNGGSAIATSTATVSPGIMDGTGYSVQAPDSATRFSGDVASFVLANSTADISHFHASVQWHDAGIRNWFSTSTADSAGVISSDGAGNLTVSTGAIFANNGIFNFVVTIIDDRLTGSAAVAGVAYGQIIVGTSNYWFPEFLAGGAVGGGTGAVDGTGTTSTANPVLSEHVKAVPMIAKAKAGETFHGDAGVLMGVYSGAAKLADLHGTIHWGDGSTSAATFAGGKGGVVPIRGSHIYAKAGTYSITVDATQTLYTNGIASKLYPIHLPTIHSTAYIVPTPAGTHPTPWGLPITAKANHSFTGPVASITVTPAPAGTTRSATIWWGDGSKTSAILSSTSKNNLTLTGTHTYKKAGVYKIWIDVLQTYTSSKGHTGKLTQVLEHLKATAVVS